MTHIYELLSRDTIRVGLSGTTKEDAIGAVVDLLRGHAAVVDLEDVREAVFERERRMSTGVGKGLGLPHAKTPAVTDTVAAFVVTRQPIPFGAIDDQPVRLVFLLVGTEEAGSQHIRVLSRISRLMNRDAFRESLLAARDADEILALFEEAEAALLES